MQMVSDISLTSASRGNALAAFALGANRPVVVADYAASRYAVSDAACAFDTLHDFTRSGPAWQRTTASALTEYPVDVPRFARDLKTGRRTGLLVEPERTNVLRNALLSGITPGQLGSGGAMPPGWATSAMTGLAVTLDRVSHASGQMSMIFRVQGTPSGSGEFLFWSDATDISALAGETFSLSATLSLAAGSLAGVTQVRFYGSGWTSSGGYISGSPNDFIGPNLLGDLTPEPRSVEFSGHLTGSGVAHLRPSIQFLFSGDPVDMTLELMLPQVELGAFATSPIPTQSEPITRVADGVSLALPKDGVYDIRVCLSDGTFHDHTDQAIAGGYWVPGPHASPIRAVAVYEQDSL